MAGVEIKLPNLTDGVSTDAMPKRSPGSLALAENSMMRRVRGLETRPGLELVKTDQTDYSLNVTNPTNTKAFHWINRDDDEKFVAIFDPANTGNARCEVFTLLKRGTGDGTSTNEKAGQKMGLTVTNHPTGGQNPLDYISAAGTTSVLQRFRAVTVADATVIVNRDVAVGYTGGTVTYKTAALANIRDTTNVNNRTSWNNLPQPPTGTAGAGVTTSDFIFFTRDNDLGWPAGWYRASSTTLPPWYTRIRSESDSSVLDWTKWPIRLNFDGTNFVAIHPTWSDRYSGDSFTNPGPQILSGPSAPHKIRDLCFFQSRLWFGGYEFLDSSQTGDVFNLWNDSYVGITDRDPVNVSFQSDAVTVVDYLIPFDGGIVSLTRGSRQFDVKSQGAMTPSTVSILPSTAISTVDYCPPAKLGNQLYFLSEQNGSMIVYEYIYQQDRSSNVASNVTNVVEGYIPSRAKVIRTSPQNDMLFVLTDGDPMALYVCQMNTNGGQVDQRAWHRWTFSDQIQDCQVFESYLYVIFKRNNKLYLERVNIDLPSDDDDGTVPTTVNGYSGSGDMAYALRLDSRASYQGVYDSGTNTTTWTVPYEDASLNRVVLGQRWDCDYEFPTGTFNEQRKKGKFLTTVAEGGVLSVTAGAGVTTLVASGNYAKNGNADDAPAWIGIKYTHRARINEQFIRDQDGVVNGKVQLKHLTLRLVSTGSFRVEVTPQGRDTITFAYTKELVGQSSLGQSLTFENYDEFNLLCMGRAHDTQVEFVNDSPYPSRLVGGTFKVGFNMGHRDPTRR